MSSLRAASLALSLAGLALLPACNFIFNPAKSDSVIRCKNATECEDEPFFLDALSTQRVDASCGAPGGSGSFTESNTNQVCSVVDKASVSCQLDMFAEDTPGFQAYASAMTEAGAYAACSAERRGSLGCPPRATGTACDAGEPNVFGVCDDGSGAWPLYQPTGELIGQDVLDQHCRSYFCDENFVCDRGNFQCRRCTEVEDAGDAAEALGNGACADLALLGKRSTVYQSEGQLGDDCPMQSDVDDTRFGAVVMSPDMP
jgi:hypothetical protein